MIQVKRNTAEFKLVRELVSDYADLATRKKWILLYSHKSYESLANRLSINNLKAHQDVLYTLAYDSLQEYLYDKSRKLFRDETEDLYYFKSAKDSTWAEMPFAFAGKLKKMLSKLQIKPVKPVKSKLVKVK